MARFLKSHKRGLTGSVHENKRLNIEAAVGLFDAAGPRNFLLGPIMGTAIKPHNQFCGPAKTLQLFTEKLQTVFDRISCLSKLWCTLWLLVWKHFAINVFTKLFCCVIFRSLTL